MPNKPTSQTLEMPDVYLFPLGTPYFWRDEQTGVLRDAVMAYLSHGAAPTMVPPPSADQLQLLIDYLRYVINAPCWRDDTGALAMLRFQAAHLATVAQVDAWIMGCLEIGIDPL